jgi:hypothetical protein
MLFYSSRFDAIAQGVAQRISMRFPPVVANDPERAVPQKRIEEILAETFALALQAGRDDGIGFLGRTWLKSAFRRELREIGYDDKFVAFAADRFVEQLSRNAG